MIGKPGRRRDTMLWAPKQIGTLMEVHHSTVRRWIDWGLLKGYLLPPVPRRPGRERVVYREDLRAFLVKYGYDHILNKLDDTPIKVSTCAPRTLQPIKPTWTPPAGKERPKKPPNYEDFF